MPEMTLTEFLLARIEEDEEEINSFGESAPMEQGPIPYPRLLAECEAKRRIADEWMAAVLQPAQGATQIVRNLDRAAILARARAFEDAMRLLALSYADHPDYRDEWRL